MKPVLVITQLSIAVGEREDGSFHLDVPELALEAGAALAITGPSGCGKSTLLEVLGLLRRPEHAGRFEFYAEPSAGPVNLNQPGDLTHLRQGPIGYVPQTGGVLPFLTAGSYINTALHLAGTGDQEAITSRLTWLTAQLELTDHLHKRRDALSGGQRKRVALLTGLAVPRTLLIADEPTAGLDADAANRVLRLLANIAEHEQTVVVIATHDVEAARAAGFTLAEISDGVLSRPRFESRMAESV